MIKRIIYSILIIGIIQCQTVYSITNDTLIVDSLNEISFCLGSSSPDSSFNIAKKALNRAQLIDYVQGELTAFLRMGQALNKKGNLDSALYYYTQAEKLFQQKGKDSIFLSKIYIYQGQILDNQNDLNSALLKFKHAYSIAAKYSNATLMRYCAIDIANLFNRNGKYQKAIEVSLIALDNVSDSNTVERGLLYLNLGNIYDNQGRCEDALYSFKHANTCFIKDNNSFNIGNSLISIANIYSYLNELDSAFIYYDLALNVAEKNDFNRQKAKIYNNKGELFFEINDLDSALYFYMKSVVLKGVNNNLSAQAITFENIGDTYMLKKMQQKALENYLKSYQRAKQFNDNLELYHITNKLSNAYAFVGDLDSTVYYLEESNLYQDSIYDELHAALLYENDFEEQKHKVELLKSESESKDLKIENQQQFIWYIAIVVGVLFLLLYYVIRLFYQKKKNYLIEQKNLQAQKEIDHLIIAQDENEINAMLNGQETERNRIATEIHDKLGGTLAVVKMYFKSMNKQIDRLKEENQIQFEKANELLDEACDEARKIAHDLSSGLISKLGLFAAVKKFKNKIEGAGEIKMEVHSYGTDDDLKILNEIAVFRIIQELVSNILKHANAKEINIQLNVFENLFNLIVEDDGVGFEMEKLKQNTGMGLRGVEARVNKMKGTFTVDSSIGKGTTISIDIPLEKEKK